MTIDESSNIQLITTSKNNISNLTFITKVEAIERVGDSCNEIDNIDIIDINSTRSVKIYKLTKSKILIWLKRTRTRFFTFGARLIFTKLRQAFIKVLIVYYFDLEYYIQIQTNVSSYIIIGIFCQLTMDDLH